MADPTADFFDELSRRGHEPLLEKASGTLRIDVVDGKRTDRWLVTVKKGDVSVSRRNMRADCVIRTDRALFDGLTSGKVNMMAAVLRGAVGVEGDVGLLVLFQRLFPGPPKSRGRRHTAGYARRQA